MNSLGLKVVGLQSQVRYLKPTLEPETLQLALKTSDL